MPFMLLGQLGHAGVVIAFVSALFGIYTLLFGLNSDTLENKISTKVFSYLS
jgi:hypothetical protein